jgi:hypothetical protein
LAYAYKATYHKEIENDTNLQVIVFGLHLHEEMGETVQGENVILKGAATGKI